MPSWKRLIARSWPWLALALAILPAIWHVAVFPDDVDPEYPDVARPTFSRLPPPAYRLAEPGDTIDRVALYASAAAVVIATAGCVGSLHRESAGSWPAALTLGLVAGWHAVTPGPTFDGWHGLGWRTIFDGTAPVSSRAMIGAAAIAALAVLVVSARRSWPDRARLWEASGRLGMRALLVASAILIACRQFEIPGVEPVGYWPRFCQVWGLLLFDFALLRALPELGVGSIRLKIGLGGLAAGAWVALVVGGISVAWLHRPLARMRAVVPGRLYISAMPTRRGLEIAQARHKFKTIINVFAEESHQRSPLLPDELRFVREHGIRFLNSPAEPERSDTFLDTTLKLAQDPDAWPILVHCHGCMDRSPAWMGIYRFVVEGRPLDDIFREIEGHRGYRPKASVTLLYNRVLPGRAPAHYAADPTAALLRRCAGDVVDREPRANPGGAGGVPEVASHLDSRSRGARVRSDAPRPKPSPTATP